ncbi:MAG: ABC transporter substrate-binding protein [Chloroflexia bacterium]|nr:ABC transporter substrate-binding protein [Chloroflexia bacterium]
MIEDPRQSLLHDILRGRVSRRELARRAGLAGIGGAAAVSHGNVLPETVIAQDGTPAADHTPTGAITWAIESDPVNLIPYGAVAGANMWGKEPMYDSLLAWDTDLQIIPALAESYEAAADGTSYTFQLREGVVFHDGRPFTSADVVYSLELAMNPPAPGIQLPWFVNVAGVEAVDEMTVTVTMTQEDPTLPGVLAWSRYSPIVPNGIADEINLLSEGIGTGPFRLVEFVPNARVVYTAFEDHWNPGVPCVQDLTLQVLPDEQSRVAALRSGEIDGGTFSPDVVMTLENDDSLEVLSGLTSAPRVIHFNTVNDAPWRDARVRQAINMAVDRQEIIDNVYGGNAELTGPVPPGYGDYPVPAETLADLYATDLEQAQALMAEAGFADGFEVTLQAIAAPRDYTQIAEIVREQLRPLNINVTVEPLEIGTFATNIGEGNFQWASTGRGMRGDPSGYVVDFRNGTALNMAWFGDGWNDDEINQLYDDGLTTTDIEERVAIYREIQQRVIEDAANIYTVQPYKFQVTGSRVTGMYVSYTDFLPGLRVACVTDG